MKARATFHVLETIELPARFDGAFERLCELFPEGRGTFLLGGGEHSFFGAEPVLTFRAYRSQHRTDYGALGALVHVEELGATAKAEVNDPFVVLRALLREHAVADDVFVGRPLPLLAGAVGYIGYEAGQMLERLPAGARSREGMPDIALSFHDWVIGRTRATAETWLSVIGRGATSAAAKRAAEITAARIRARIANADANANAGANANANASAHAGANANASAHANARVTRAEYMDLVRVAKGHIEAGDAFEICLTHRFDVAFAGRPLELFADLRRRNPAPFAAFLDLPEGAVVSSSPERFLSLDRHGVAESRPIKGTRPRGSSPEEDDRLATDLAVSAKDRAENAMIVDLVRNDLGRVCRYGTVVAPELFAVEKHPTVHQLVSTVRGELDAGRDAIDLLRACFPPGSMTGAPKIEAMSILEGLEDAERGVYSGALGYFAFDGTMDLSVVIRTAVIKDGRAYLHTGGAIVTDSDPASEHDETLHKARAVLEALGASVSDDIGTLSARAAGAEAAPLSSPPKTDGGRRVGRA